MQHNSFELRATEDTPIHVNQWLPDNESSITGVVQIAHGMAEHSGRYERFARRLTEAGYVVFADDHRGHGKTVKDNAEFGHFSDRNGWDLVINDLHVLTQRIRSEYPKQPLTFFGHSMGSYLGQSYLIKHSNDLDAAILSGTQGNIGPMRLVGLGLVRAEKQRLGVMGRSPLADKLSFSDFNRHFQPTRTDFDWLTSDRAEVDKFIADPLCGFRCTNATWYELLRAMGANSRKKNQQKIKSTLPIFLITGEEDTSNHGMLGIKSLEHAYIRAGIEHIETKGYANNRHETLNEVNREEVMHDLVSWINRSVQ